MPRLFLLEDDASLAEGLAWALGKQGFEVSCAATLAQARAWPGGMAGFDILVLDVGLPDGSGFTFCESLRAAGCNTPILFLTAAEEEVNIIRGLDGGGDDYMTKPFRPLELIARVKAQLRRFTKYNTAAKEEEQDCISISGLVINKRDHTCTLDEKPLSLTPTEFSILWSLCKNRGEVVSSDRLFYDVWGEKYYSSNNNTIMVHIRHLREKMHDSSEKPKYIKTVWGVGYKIE